MVTHTYKPRVRNLMEEDYEFTASIVSPRLAWVTNMSKFQKGPEEIQWVIVCIRAK